MSPLSRLLLGSFCLALGGCAAESPYHVEYPLLRTKASVADSPPEVHFERGRSLRIVSASATNGMTGRAVERPGSGLVSIAYVTRGARMSTDYVPVFVADALRAGARRSDGSVVYPIAVAGRGPEVRTSVLGTTISVTCPIELFDEALELIAAMVQRPIFDPTWLAPVRARTQLDLLQSRSMYWTWLRASQHADQPLRVDAELIAEQLRSLDQAALERAHRLLFEPQDSSLIVVGDLSAERALAAFESRFSEWRASAASAPVSAPTPEPTAVRDESGAAPVAKRSSRKLLIFEGQGYPYVSIVQNAPASDSPDAVPFQLLQAVLSGLGKSGVMNALRYERGHAYYAGSKIVVVPQRGNYLMISTSVSAQTLAADITDVLRILGELRSAPVDASALDAAKARFSMLRAATFASTESTADYLANVELRCTPTLDEIEAKLDGVTAEDIRRVALRYFDPETATIIISGSVASAMPALGRLGEVWKR